MIHPFLSFWEQSYGGIPPFKWRLKERLPDRWLRIHTLPDSKRYAGTEAEFAEIAERQVTAAEALLDHDAPVWLVTELRRLDRNARVPGSHRGGEAEDSAFQPLV
jgi:hypothetical protein